MKANLYSKHMGNGTKPALFLGLRPTQDSYRSQQAKKRISGQKIIKELDFIISY